jgi:Zn-dependent peptidase ImmA (M78 family)/DNA-binding XRE family transcriptional regulator
MAEALINSEILTWARKRARMDVAQLARSLKASVSQVSSWEAGQSRPSLNKTIDLAKTLSVPLGYLFLSRVPKEDLEISDLRTVADREKYSLSLNFRDALQGALLKQQWFKDYRATEDFKIDFLRPSLTEHVPDEALATLIRSALGWTDDTRHDCATASEYLTELVKLAETLGILVMRSGVVGSNNRRTLSVSEFRGFALADHRAPVIFINSSDAKTAQVFTFAHELAHISLGRSGVSNPESIAATGKGPDIEIRCNGIAASLVAPAKDIVAVWKTKATAASVAAHFRVSEVVILRRALTLRIIDEKYFREKLAAIPVRTAKKGKGGNFHTTLPARNSPLFTRTLIGEVKRGSVGYREAGRLLGVKPSTINKLGKGELRAR